MKNWGEIIIKEKRTVSGRGLVFIVDLFENKLTEDTWVQDIYFRVHDMVMDNGVKYEIIGIEYFTDLMIKPKIKSCIGLVVKRK